MDQKTSYISLRNNKDALCHRKSIHGRLSNELKNLPRTSFDGTDNQILGGADNHDLSKNDCRKYITDVNDPNEMRENDKAAWPSIEGVVHDGSKQIICRTQRFCTEKVLYKSFTDARYDSSKFLYEWARRNMAISDKVMVEQMACGIEFESIRLNQNTIGKTIPQNLRNVSEKSRAQIELCCLQLYTYECFLYKLVNHTLRENDLSKVNTLGTYCHVLYYCNRSEHVLQIGYRG